MLKSIALASILTIGATVSFAAEQTVTLSVPGMYCASCPYIVKGAIAALPGIKSVEPSLEKRQAVVVFDDEAVKLADITAATENVGYESTVIEPQG